MARMARPATPPRRRPRTDPWGCGVADDWRSGSAFDPATWRSYSGSVVRETPRGGMLADLEARHLRPGMPRDEVLALLGIPDRRDRSRLIYRLGASAFGPDYEYYVIELDPEGRVSRFFVSRA